MRCMSCQPSFTIVGPVHRLGTTSLMCGIRCVAHGRLVPSPCLADARWPVMQVSQQWWRCDDAYVSPLVPPAAQDAVNAQQQSFPGASWDPHQCEDLCATLRSVLPVGRAHHGASGDVAVASGDVAGGTSAARRMHPIWSDVSCPSQGSEATRPPKAASKLPRSGSATKSVSPAILGSSEVYMAVYAKAATTTARAWLAHQDAAGG